MNRLLGLIIALVISEILSISCRDNAQKKQPTPAQEQADPSHMLEEADKARTQENSNPLSSPIDLVKMNYPADRFSLFTGNMEGVFKKKIRIANETRNAMVLVTPKRVERFLVVPPDASIAFGIGMVEQSFKGKGDGILFRLHIKSKTESLTTIFERYIDAKNTVEDRRWFDQEIDLATYANMPVTLIFEVLGSNKTEANYEPDITDDFAVISDPTIRTPKPKNINAGDYNVILLSIDTLRADHLGCYGCRRKDISPKIDALAEKGVLFEQTISQSPWTIPSHMSMLTGLHPSFHRVNESYKKFAYFIRGEGDGYRILGEDIETLPEKLRSNGYKTLAITSGGTVAGQLGFHKGFDVFWEVPLLNKMAFLSTWFDKNRRQKFFMFLHTMRVHAPYMDFAYADEVMSKEQRQIMSGFLSDVQKDTLKEITDVPFENDRVLIAAQRYVLKQMGLYNAKVAETLYDGGITTIDSFVGQLMDVLKKRGLLDRTIVIITSDHGEEFGERDPDKFYDYHGRNVYDEMIRVPLIVLMPKSFPRKKRIASQVRLIDIMPTVLESVGIPYEKSTIQGVSLLPLMTGQKNLAELVAFTEATAVGPEKKSVRTLRKKYISETDMPDNNMWERIFVPENPDIEMLYDLIRDPEEKTNIAQENPKQVKLLSKQLLNLMGEAVRQHSKQQTSRRIVVDEAMKQRLKELGYIQ